MMIKRLLVVIVVVVVSLVDRTGSSDIIRGPPRAERSAVKHVARIGQDVRIKCAIEAYPAPLFSWSKEGETIDFTWVRFRTGNKMLRIRATEPEDSGVYYCKGINGFGTAEVRIDLMVIDLKDFPTLSESDLSRLAPPSFPTEASQQTMVRMVGETVRLSCIAEGWPEPQLSWYRDGEQLPERSNSLLLRQVTGSDSASYSCLAQNLVGSAALEYTLQVRDEQALQPDIRLGQANLTVNQGDTARLDCRVRSAQMPHIKWLRRLEPGSRSEDDSDGEIIPVGEEKYRLIASSRTVELSGGEEYLSQLVLASVVPNTAGLYVCLVTTSSGGFNFQRSFLTVKQRLSMAEEELAPMAVVIAVAALLLLALAVLTAICCLQRRRRRSLLSANDDAEPQKASNKMAPNVRGKDDIQIAANKMEDLLQHNTQQLLQQSACVNSNLYVESLHNNEYEVPHSERSCYGYYDLRDVVRPAALR